MTHVIDDIIMDIFSLTRLLLLLVVVVIVCVVSVVGEELIVVE